MKARITLVLLPLIIIGSNFTLLNAQMCGSHNTSIDSLINDVEKIVLGKVISQHSFWYNNNIYTKHTIEVEQSTDLGLDFIYALTEGGRVDDISFKIYGQPSINLHSQGIFFLDKENATSYNQTDSIYYSITDFRIYEASTGTIENSNSFITIDYFNKLLKAKHKSVFNFKQVSQKNSKLKQISITSISPLKVAAGNNDVLTINGFNFGNLTGSAKVSMRSAGSLDTSVYEYIDAAYILSWVDTKIEFIVPGYELTDNTVGVASGTIKVTNEEGEIITSTQTVEVRYNKKIYDGVPVSLRSKENDGTIAIYVEQQLINDGALPAIQNVLYTWNCATGSNFVYAGVVTNICKKYDGLNVLCYDDSVAPTALASTRVVSRNCSATGFADQLDADIRINPNINWEFTNDLGFSEYHFESVILHEFGHVFMLGHVVNEEDIMYPLLYNGSIKRELMPNDVAGGLDVMSVSLAENDCSSYGAITPFNVNEECNPSVINQSIFLSLTLP